MSAQRDLVIGVDVGGTTVKAALIGIDGLEYGHIERPTPRQLGPDAVIATTIRAIDELRAQVPEDARLRAVGLVVPGVVDAQQGIAVYAANIGWQQFPLRQIVAEAIGLPVILDHDVRAAGLAELELGAGRGLQEVLFVALGTGVAAAVITRGQVLAGSTGRAGELGHLPVFPEGEWCACGQRGCTETYASAAALSRRYAAASGISDVSAKDVISRAAAGDAVADGIFRTPSLPWVGPWCTTSSSWTRTHPHRWWHGRLRRGTASAAHPRGTGWPRLAPGAGDRERKVRW